MTVTIYGATDVVEGDRDKVWERAGQYDETVQYVGSIQAATDYFNNLVQQLGPDNVRLRKSKGIGTVSVKTSLSDGGDDDSTSGIWTVQSTPLEKPLESFGGITCPVAGHGTHAFNLNADLPVMQESIKQANLGNFGYTPAEPGLKYMKLRTQGTVAYMRGYVTLNWTRVMSGAVMNTRITFVGCDRAFTEQDHNGGPYNVSSAIQSRLSTIPGYNTAKKQWLKQWPNIETVDNSNYRVTQSWVWAERWSHALYQGDDEDGNP